MNKDPDLKVRALGATMSATTYGTSSMYNDAFDNDGCNFEETTTSVASCP